MAMLCTASPLDRLAGRQMVMEITPDSRSILSLENQTIWLQSSNTVKHLIWDNKITRFLEPFLSLEEWGNSRQSTFPPKSARVPVKTSLFRMICLPGGNEPVHTEYSSQMTTILYFLNQEELSPLWPCQLFSKTITNCN